ncbi:telomerase Cajal body protein 1-like [Xenia sp. Carnegie-2017]|uniref:telomerase Cajal body protein 1-like n=1 Tax=Xenia sp. Carnegie-2017 TaxID=2897299 RepID=UPI001F037AE7|nr:telomerase Cajal body protein 1-like [Xenia sp. Carnegie-2017]
MTTNLEVLENISDVSDVLIEKNNEIAENGETSKQEVANSANEQSSQNIKTNVESSSLCKVTCTTENENNRDNIRYYMDFSMSPHQITGSWSDYETSSDDNFLKGCKWSPDGTCILTCSDDNILKLYNLPYELYSNFATINTLPEMKSVLAMREGETIYDYNWYPKMSSYEPDTCCFISSSRDHPLHMWDAFTGQMRCSYRAYNQLDEIVSPHSVAFNLDGSKIYCGFNKMICIFDTCRPGRQCQSRPTVSKKQGQPGIISCIAISPEQNGLYACGSFSKSVGIYCEQKGSLLTLLEGHQGGVTHLLFSQDGLKLYSGARKDNEIICWDLRNPGDVLFVMKRSVKTNQRMYFDVDSSGKYIVSGNHDGTVSIWDTCASSNVILPCLMTYKGHNDCVNGVSLHPSLPFLATASGQRTFLLPDDVDFENDDVEINKTKVDNSLRLWRLNFHTEEMINVGT